MGRPFCVGWSRTGGVGGGESGQTAFFDRLMVVERLKHRSGTLPSISIHRQFPFFLLPSPFSQCVRARRQVLVIQIPAATQQTSVRALPCSRYAIYFSPHSNTESHADHRCNSRSVRPRHPNSSRISPTSQGAGRTVQIYVHTTITTGTVNLSRISRNLRSQCPIFPQSETSRRARYLQACGRGLRPSALAYPALDSPILAWRAVAGTTDKAIPRGRRRQEPDYPPGRSTVTDVLQTIWLCLRHSPPVAVSVSTSPAHPPTRTTNARGAVVSRRTLSMHPSIARPAR